MRCRAITRWVRSIAHAARNASRQTTALPPRVRAMPVPITPQPRVTAQRRRRCPVETIRATWSRASPRVMRPAIRSATVWSTSVRSA